MQIILASAKIMRQSGNMQQWTDGYPSEAVILSDMEKNGGFVVEEDSQIVGYFAFLASIYLANGDERLAYQRMG